MTTCSARWTNPLDVQNLIDGHGNPTGGSITGLGLGISWQDGPLGRGAEQRAPTGAFLEDVILAAIVRLRFFQASKFACRENAIALTKLEEALHWLQARHDDREARGVQGLHEP